jgi:hypothetical protein
MPGVLLAFSKSQQSQASSHFVFGQFLWQGSDHSYSTGRPIDHYNQLDSLSWCGFLHAYYSLAHKYDQFLDQVHHCVSRLSEARGGELLF